MSACDVIVPDVAAERARVVAIARTWLRTPYHHAARLRGVGVDCAMLPAAVYAQAGLIPALDVPAYPPDWHLHRSEERYLEMVELFAVRAAEPRPGDLALYRYGRTLSHGAVVVAWPQIIHAARDVGVVLADGLAGEMGRRLAGVWTLRAWAAASEGSGQ